MKTTLGMAIQRNNNKKKKHYWVSEQCRFVGLSVTTYNFCLALKRTFQLYYT